MNKKQWYVTGILFFIFPFIFTVITETTGLPMYIRENIPIFLFLISFTILLSVICLINGKLEKK